VYDRRVEEVTAFVLAGGKSTRMGRDKAFVELGGRTLLTRAQVLAQSVAERVVIVGCAEKFSRLGPVVEDVFLDRGPLGGIHAALSGTTSEWNLILAVDTPFLEADFLRWLLKQACESEAVVTVPRIAGRWQPLSGVYRRSFAEPAKRALEVDRNKIDPLFRGVTTRVIEEEEILGLGYSSEMFRNLNTMEEVLSNQGRAPAGDPNREF
jgi:molybdopterin-guanine dinucleotide biosynthesis protein A